MDRHQGQRLLRRLPRQSYAGCLTDTLPLKKFRVSRFEKQCGANARASRMWGHCLKDVMRLNNSEGNCGPTNLIGLVKSDAAEQVHEAGIVAHWIEEGMHSEKLQDVGLLLVGSPNPNKCLVVVGEAQVRVNKSASWNVARLPPLL